jgi:Cys-rich repeat protein
VTRRALLALAALVLAGCDGQIHLRGGLGADGGGARDAGPTDRGSEPVASADGAGGGGGGGGEGGVAVPDAGEEAAEDAAQDAPADRAGDAAPDTTGVDVGADRPVDAGVDAPAPGTCTADTQCPSGLRCETGSKTCVPCLGNSDCTDGTHTRCDLNDNRCVECVQPSDCGSSSRTCTAGHRCATICVKSGPNTCVAPTPNCEDGNICSACSDDGPCASGVCVLTEGVCVQCIDNTRCSGSKPLCDLVTNTCVQCLSKSDCAAPTPFCNPTTGLCAAGR